MPMPPMAIAASMARERRAAFTGVISGFRFSRSCGGRLNEVFPNNEKFYVDEAGATRAGLLGGKYGEHQLGFPARLWKSSHVADLPRCIRSSSPRHARWSGPRRRRQAHVGPLLHRTDP